MKKYLLNLFIFILLALAETVFAGLVELEEIEYEAYSPTTAATARLDALMKMSSDDFSKIIQKELKKIMSPSEQLTQLQQTNLGYEPRITLIEWIKRISFSSDVPREVIIGTIIILKRFLSQDEKPKLTRNNAYRLFLTAYMLSSKMHEDVTYKNSDWVIIGGRWYSLKKLNSMELEMLKLLDFNVYIGAREFYEFILTIDLS